MESISTRKLLLSGTSVLMISVLMPMSATAQESDNFSRQPGNSERVLDEIVVTAQKRAENSQDVGIAIKALPANLLKEMGITDTVELGYVVPGLEIENTFQVAIPTFSVRGLGSFTFLQNTTNAVGVYADGVSIPYSTGQNFLLFDLERVEVLKGPQSTLYGRNTTGGAINVISAKPTDTFEGYVEATIAEFDTKEVRGAVSGPLTDNMQGRIAATYSITDGFFTNTANGNDERSDSETWGLRGSLAWQPTDSMAVEWSAMYGESILGQGGFNPFPNLDRTAVEASLAELAAGNINLLQHVFNPNFPQCSNILAQGSNCVDVLGNRDDNLNPYENPFNIDDKQKFVTFNTNLKVNMELGNGITLTSLTGYQDVRREEAGIDTDSSTARLLELVQNSEYYSISQEFNLQGQMDRFNWISGFYFSYDEIELDDGVNLLVDLLPGGIFNGHEMTQKFTNTAVFGQVEYDLTDTVSLTGGLRYTWTNLKANGVNSQTIPLFGLDHVPVSIIDIDDDVSALSGKLGVEWQATDDVLLYATYNRGFRSGQVAGFFTTLPVEVTNPEKVNAYEVGLKSDLLDRSLRFNAAAFFYDFEDLIAATFTGGSAEVLNFGRAEILGAEADIQWLPTNNLELGLAVSYLDSELIEVGGSNSIRLANFAPAEGQTLAYAPKLSASGSARYEREISSALSAFVQINARYQAETAHQSDREPILVSDDYFTVDARIGLLSTDGGWQVSIWGKNLNDANWTTHSFNTGLGAYVFYPNPPRRFGVDLRHSF